MTMARERGFTPEREWNGPGAGAEDGDPKCRRRAGARVSKIRELLPEPLTPEMQLKAPKGRDRSKFFKLWVVTPLRWSQSLNLAGRGGEEIFLRPERKAPVREWEREEISFGVPCPVICPPEEPAPGPNSIR